MIAMIVARSGIQVAHGFETLEFLTDGACATSSYALTCAAPSRAEIEYVLSGADVMMLVFLNYY